MTEWEIKVSLTWLTLFIFLHPGYMHSHTDFRINPAPVFFLQIALDLENGLSRWCEQELHNGIPHTVNVILPGKTRFIMVKRVFICQAATDPSFLTAQRLGACVLQRFFNSLDSDRHDARITTLQKNELQRVWRRIVTLHNAAVEILKRAKSIFDYRTSDDFLDFESKTDFFASSFRYLYPEKRAELPASIQDIIIRWWHSEDDYIHYENKFFEQKIAPELQLALLTRDWSKLKKSVAHALKIISSSPKPHVYYIGAINLYFALIGEKDAQHCHELKESLLAAVKKTRTVSFQLCEDEVDDKNRSVCDPRTTFELISHYTRRRNKNHEKELSFIEKMVEEYASIKRVTIASSDPLRTFRPLAYNPLLAYQNFKMLKKLKIEKVAFDKPLLIPHFPQLEKLTVNFPRSKSIEGTLQLMPNSLPHLQTFKTSVRSQKGAKALFHQLLKAAPSLKECKIAAITQLPSVQGEAFTGDLFDGIEALPHLKRLSLNSTNVALSFIEKLMEKAGFLEQLNTIANITPDTSVHLKHRYLTEIGLPDNVVPELFIEAPALKKLIVGDLGAIRNDSQSKNSVRLDHIEQLTAGNISLARGGNFSSLSFPSLKKALLMGITPSDENIIQTLPAMPLVQELQISPELSHRCGIKRAALQHFPHLESLYLGIDIANEGQETDSLSVQLDHVKHCTRFIDFTQQRDNWVMPIFKGLVLPRLETLTLYIHTPIPDDRDSVINWKIDPVVLSCTELKIKNIQKLKDLKFLELIFASIHAPVSKIDLSHFSYDEEMGDEIFTLVKRYFPFLEELLLSSL